MSSPLDTPGFGDLYVGDPADDDGQVIDSFLVEVDTPPTLPQNTQTVLPLDRPKPFSRFLTGTVVLDNNTIVAGTAVMILQPDKNRLSVRLDGYSYATTPGQNDYVSVSDEPTKAQWPTGGWRMRHGKGHEIDDATNAIWVYPASGIATNNFEVTWVAVTK